MGWGGGCYKMNLVFTNGFYEITGWALIGKNTFIGRFYKEISEISLCYVFAKKHEILQIQFLP